MTGEPEKMTVKCLYCAKDIQPDEVVFYREAENGDRDEKYALFQSHIQQANGNQHFGFYYTLKDNREQIEVAQEEKGYPLTIRVQADQEQSEEGEQAGELITPTWTLTKKLCPHCHCELPLDTMVHDDIQHHVLMLGGSGAGKTSYIVAALRQMQESFSRNLQMGTFEICEESRPYFDDMEAQYRNEGQVATTTRKDRQMIFPMAFHIGVTDDKGNFVKGAYVILHDFPGEGMHVPDYAANLYALDKMDTVIVMADVHQFYPIQTENGDDVGNGTRSYNRDFMDMFNRLRDSVLPLMKVETVVGILLKVDLIMKDDQFGGKDGYIVKESPLSDSDLTDQHRQAVDMSVIDNNSNAVDDLIRCTTRSGSGLSERLISQFSSVKEKPKAYKCFAVSTFSLNKTTMEWENSPDRPGHRVLEPLLYLLAHWGIVQEKPVEQEHVSWFGRLFGRRRNEMEK